MDKIKGTGRLGDRRHVCDKDKTSTVVEAVVSEGKTQLFGICWFDIIESTLEVSDLVNCERDVDAGAEGRVGA